MAVLLLGGEKIFLPPAGLSHRPPERRGRCLPVRTCTDLEDDVPGASAPTGAACPTATQAVQFSDFPFVTLTAGGEPGSAPHPHWCTASGSDTACHTPTLPAGGAGRSWTLEGRSLPLTWLFLGITFNRITESEIPRPGSAQGVPKFP